MGDQFAQVARPDYPDRPSFPVVGIGASAGGLQAFELFFTHLPSENGMAFVVVQHLDPNHESILASILQRYTPMPVTQVTDGVELQPNHVYVIPPNRDMAILRNTLHLIEPGVPRALRLPIDFFFRSLADEMHEHAIGIVLSGTGTDGTLGLRAIKGNSGMAMVQEPTSARYDGMPRSAIDTDLVDYILRPEEMPKQLLEYTHHEFVTGERRSLPLFAQSSDMLQKIYILLRNQTGHDFSQYRKSTLIRRIERRMAINQITWIADYVRYLQHSPQEVMTLFRELFIGVTGFFRDPEAFQSLQQQVIVDLLKNRPPQQPVRIWVPGCSTGEEAFSLAILLRESMNALQRDVNVQIFATDIDSVAVEHARTAIFPNSISAELSPERLQHFFQHENDTYQVSRAMRELVVFAVQSVIKDPPFSNLDLISCRNLLIYFEPELQARVLALFHRSLKPHGFLFLGTSESVGTSEQLFTPLDRHWQIYQRSQGTVQLSPLLDFPEPTLIQVPQTRPASKRDTELELRALAERTLLDEVAPPGVVVNESGDILYIHGKTGKYWETESGKPHWNIFHIAREELQFALTMIIRKVITQKKAVVREEASIIVDGIRQTIYLSVRPIVNTRCLLVIFEEGLPTLTTQFDPAEGQPDVRDQYIYKLERDLQAAQDYLYATNEELLASNEELRSSNEELQSSNEELHSANEQLGTSKEELQSVNEELVTVNAELKNSIDQLYQANNYLRNLLANIDVGIIFLDQELRVAWFTPTVSAIVHLIETDVGRPLSDLLPNIDYEMFIHDAQSVLDTLEVKEAEVRVRDTDEWYWMRITPYRTVDNVIDGVVLVFTRITEQKHTFANLRKLTGAVEQSSSMIIITNTLGDIEYVNPRFSSVTGYTRDEVIGENLRVVKSDEQNLALYAESLRQAMSGQEWRGEFQNRKKNGQIFWVSATRAPVRDPSGVITHLITIEDDITERKQRDADLAASEQFLQSIYTGIDIPIFVIDVVDGDFIYVGNNPASERMTGYSPADFRGKRPDDFAVELQSDGIKRAQANYQRCVETGAVVEYEQVTYIKGQQEWWLMRLQPLKDLASNQVYRIVGTAHSITDLRQIHHALQRHQTLLESLGRWWQQIDDPVSTEESLLQAMVHLLVETGGYAAAWVGLADANQPDAFALTQGAVAADLSEHVAAQAWLMSIAGPCLGSVAWRENRVVLLHDLTQAPLTATWYATAYQYGWVTVIAVPFGDQATVGGGLVVFNPASVPVEEDSDPLVPSVAAYLATGIRLLRQRAS